jgi:hypothetical protein
MSGERLILLCAALAAPGALLAQTQVDLRTQSKSVDFSNAASTRPMSAGNSLPATCAASQMFFLLTAPPGANVYACVATNQWAAQGGGTLGGDLSGSTGAATVTGLQGRPVSSAAPSSGQTLVWDEATQSWQPQGALLAGAVVSGQLGDFAVTISNATTLTAGQNCSAATPCNFRFGTTTYSIAAPAVVVLGDSDGTVYLYLTSDGVLAAGSTMSIACTAVCAVRNGVSAFPPGSIPLATVTATAGAWNGNGITDYRGFLSAASIAAGSGISSTVAGPTTTLSIDSSVVSLKVAAPASASTACTPGSWATDGGYYYLCVATNQWKRAALASW